MITVTLTQEEIAERARSLAQYANRLAELADEEEGAKARHKQLMADIKERRLDISNELRRLSRAVRLGVEERTTQRVLFDEEQRMEEFRQQQAGNGASTIPEGASPNPSILCWCKHKYVDHRNGTFCRKKNCGCNSFSWAGEAKQGDGNGAELEKRPTRAKLSPVEAAIDR